MSEHSLTRCCAQQAETNVGAQFVAKKQEVLQEWEDSNKEWEYLKADVLEIRPQMQAVDEVSAVSGHCRRRSMATHVFTHLPET